MIIMIPKKVILAFTVGLSMVITAGAHKAQITSAQLPPPIGPFSQAVLSTSSCGDKTLYISGILPTDKATGQQETDPAQATNLCMGYIAALLNEAGMMWDNVVDVIILLRDINDFQVVSGTYATYLQGANVKILPARACFQAGALPRNAVVEIKATAIQNAG